MTKKLAIYFSDDAWSSLQKIMGKDGQPSPTINKLIEQASLQTDLSPQLEFKIFDPVTFYQIPISSELISAGFPSPAQDHIEDKLDLNTHLISNKSATFIGKVGSESMLLAGFEIGDEIIVDRSLEADHQDIVIAIIDNKDFTMKRLMITAKMSKEEIAEIFGDVEFIPKIWLKAENPEFTNIIPKRGQSVGIWGVITYNLKKVHKRK